MALVATSVKVEKDKLELAKLKGASVSQLTRDAINSYSEKAESPHSISVWSVSASPQAQAPFQPVL